MTRYAFFDLDHTLTRKDTGQLFLLHCARKRPSIYLRFAAGIPLALLWKLGLFSLQRLKEFFFGFIRRQSVEEIDALARAFMDSLFAGNVFKPEGIAELERLKKEGFIPVLASASPELYIRHIAGRLGIGCYAGSRYAVADGRYTGKMDGKDCRGEEKILRVAALIDLDNYDRSASVAYSDSRADLPLLGLAAGAYFVHRTRWETEPL